MLAVARPEETEMGLLVREAQRRSSWREEQVQYSTAPHSTVQYSTVQPWWGKPRGAAAGAKSRCAAQHSTNVIPVLCSCSCETTPLPSLALSPHSFSFFVCSPGTPQGARNMYMAEGFPKVKNPGPWTPKST